MTVAMTQKEAERLREGWTECIGLASASVLGGFRQRSDDWIDSRMMTAHAEWRMDRRGARMGPCIPLGLGEEVLWSGPEWTMDVVGSAGIRIIPGSRVGRVCDNIK